MRREREGETGQARMRQVRRCSSLILGFEAVAGLLVQSLALIAGGSHVHLQLPLPPTSYVPNFNAWALETRPEEENPNWRYEKLPLAVEGGGDLEERKGDERRRRGA